MTAPTSKPSRVRARPARDAGSRPSSAGWSAWLADPRTAVLAFLASALLFGGGRKLLQGVRARRAVAALETPDPSPEEVESAAEHGRAGLIDLFRLLGTAEKPEVRDAAGRALASLWARDELIVEEEKRARPPRVRRRPAGSPQISSRLEGCRRSRSRRLTACLFWSRAALA